MPWKLILFILSVTLVTIFIGFNLENACNVSFGFYTFPNVPIFMSILLAFAAGVFIMLPFTFGHRKKDKISSPKKIVSSQKPPVYTGTSDTKEKSNTASSSTTEVK